METITPESPNEALLMENSTPGPRPPKDIKPQMALTREQKRILMRVEQEAKDTCQRLCERFLKFFMDSSDPEGEGTIKYMAILNGQWRTYCKQKRLSAGAADALSNYMTSVIEEFKASK